MVVIASHNGGKNSLQVFGNMGKNYKVIYFIYLCLLSDSVRSSDNVESNEF
jgi:hypothetical protein